MVKKKKRKRTLNVFPSTCFYIPVLETLMKKSLYFAKKDFTLGRGGKIAYPLARRPAQHLSHLSAFLSSRQRVKASPKFTLVWSFSWLLSLFLFFATSNNILFCLFAASAMICLTDNSEYASS